jgi:hypothetical protein
LSCVNIFFIVRSQVIDYVRDDVHAPVLLHCWAWKLLIHGSQVNHIPLVFESDLKSTRAFPFFRR